jgi:hypothetical protein
VFCDISGVLHHYEVRDERVALRCFVSRIGKAPERDGRQRK